MVGGSGRWFIFNKVFLDLLIWVGFFVVCFSSVGGDGF